MNKANPVVQTNSYVLFCSWFVLLAGCCSLPSESYLSDPLAIADQALVELTWLGPHREFGTLTRGSYFRVSRTLSGDFEIAGQHDNRHFLLFQISHFGLKEDEVCVAKIVRYVNKDKWTITDLGALRADGGGVSPPNSNLPTK